MGPFGDGQWWGRKLQQPHGGNLGRDIVFNLATPLLGSYRTNYTQTCVQICRNKDFCCSVVFITKNQKQHIYLLIGVKFITVQPYNVDCYKPWARPMLIGGSFPDISVSEKCKEQANVCLMCHRILMPLKCLACSGCTIHICGGNDYTLECNCCDKGSLDALRSKTQNRDCGASQLGGGWQRQG